MSNLILDRPVTARRQSTPTAPEPAPRVGSYVDTDGVRRTPVRVGSYVARSGAGAPSVGSYTDRDGARRAVRQGSYVSAERRG